MGFILLLLKRLRTLSNTAQNEPIGVVELAQITFCPSNKISTVIDVKWLSSLISGASWL